MSSIHWPAVVKLAQHDELIYLDSHRDWIELACLYQHGFHHDDRLLDSQGRRYAIVPAPGMPISAPVAELASLQLLDSDMPVFDFIKLVRQHAMTAGHCCVAKLAFTTIAQGIELVKYLEETAL
ncbi:DUF4144 family protein [Shewanella salipaludis]|uniref:Uncharacterized protein n=1 Tax=Shewanella salipaludis TaxID=2723052 RepID=A0A972FTB5_9GAMM|nr:DUF4144 family protein [Shewanella salipaludis]NMH65838.1 hypothetical protein [Shewanella salipaludis]